MSIFDVYSGSRNKNIVGKLFDWRISILVKLFPKELLLLVFQSFSHNSTACGQKSVAKILGFEKVKVCKIEEK